MVKSLSNKLLFYHVLKILSFNHYLKELFKIYFFMFIMLKLVIKNYFKGTRQKKKFSAVYQKHSLKYLS